MKTLIYSAWTCALMSGMMLFCAIDSNLYEPLQKSWKVLTISAFCSLMFWVELSFFLQRRSKKLPWEPARSLKIVAFVFAALYMFTFLLLFA